MRDFVLALSRFFIFSIALARFLARAKKKKKSK
jgi:hypothetical protein